MRAAVDASLKAPVEPPQSENSSDDVNCPISRLPTLQIAGILARNVGGCARSCRAVLKGKSNAEEAIQKNDCPARL